MSEATESGGTEGRALADELRAIAEALPGRELGEAELREATALARGIREKLRGAPRTRWYHGPTEPGAMTEESRRAYLEQSPIRGQLNPVAPPLSVRIVSGGDGRARALARVRMGRQYEGPPHGVHGGWVAALFDEVLGAVQGASGPAGVTAILKVRYRQVTPLEEDLRLEAQVHEIRGRRTVARATCHAGDTLTADAEGVFVAVDFDAVRRRGERRETSGAAGVSNRGRERS